MAAGHQCLLCVAVPPEVPSPFVMVVAAEVVARRLLGRACSVAAPFLFLVPVVDHRSAARAPLVVVHFKLPFVLVVVVEEVAHRIEV